MNKKDDVFYITTPIYYVNDVPHIGHAYTTIAADVLTRWHASGGYDTRMLTGTDEHGQKIQQAAQARGMTPIELCDEVVVNFQRLWKVLGIGNDDFIRTTEPRHERVVQEIFRKLMEQGDIYKGEYEGWYCVPCETYVPEAQMGEGNTCPDCKRPLSKMTEESYFFKISRYQQPLLDFYESHPDAILPRSRYNEIVSFIKSGLKDQSVSRTTLSWGVPLPGDEKHVIYVWFDALINYLSAMSYPDAGAMWERYWPSVRHLVGKDIIRFHCVIWPAMLLALGLNPPVRVFAHGWWTVEKEKMSKSKGNVVDPFEMTDLYGADAFRYFLLREVPFGNDGDYSEAALVGRINSDLANDLGNLLNRTLQMIEKNFGGKLPLETRPETIDKAIEELTARTLEEAGAAMERFAFDEALKALWTLIGAANKYIDETAPWKLAKLADDPNARTRLSTVLRTLWEVLRFEAVLIAPFMPQTARRVWAQLGLAARAPEALTNRAGWKWMGGAVPDAVEKADVLFPRIDLEAWKKEKKERDEKKMNANTENISNTSNTSKPEYDYSDHEPEVVYDDFKKLEFRVAQVLSCEAVPKADKLYKIEVDLGYERRVIVSGIREYYTPEEMIGKKIIVICNLAARKLRGIESHGMLLAAESPVAEGAPEFSLALLTVDQDIPVGSRIH